MAAHRIRFWVLAGLTGLFVALAAGHWPVLNGPPWWSWPWRALDAGTVYPWTLGAGAFAVAALGLSTRPALALLLAMIGAGALFWTGAMLNGPDAATRIAAVVESVEATSYFTHAQGLKDGWLADYPAQLNAGVHHARNKPPGPLAFYRAVVDAGFARPALAGGILVGLLAVLAVPATYVMARSLGATREQGAAGAALLALMPGYVLFFPEFDQAFAALGALMVATWAWTLAAPPDPAHGPSAMARAVMFGAVLTLALLWSYALLTLGLVLAVLTVRAGLKTGAWTTIAWRAAVALATVIGLHAGLYFATGYDPLATFATAVANQRELLTHITRPWPLTVPFDLADLALGAGWVVTALAVMAAGTTPRPMRLESATTMTARWGLLAVAGIVLTGLLPGETARVMIFALPWIAFAAGLELARWPASWRIGAGVLALIGVAETVRTMTFIVP